MLKIKGVVIGMAFRTLFRLAIRGQFFEIARRITSFVKLQMPAKRLQLTEADAVVVMTPPHTLLHANNLVRALAKHGIVAQIDTVRTRKNFEANLYFVIAPQYFDHLPPGGKRVIYQVEQLKNSRFVDDEYFQNLQESYAVLEYAKQNLGVLEENGVVYPHVYYVPFCGDAELHLQLDAHRDKKTRTPLMYGDFSSSQRRVAILKALASHKPWKLLDSSFGRELHAELRRHSHIVNYHYFEDALLETPRIFEALTFGATVISETTEDLDDYPELASVVKFISRHEKPEDFISKVESTIREGELISETAIAAALQRADDRFFSLFDRFLFAAGIINAEQFLVNHNLQLTENSINCLTLTETVDRNEAAKLSAPLGTHFLEGVRYRPGWIGCGYSYKSIAVNAIRQGIRRITVFEDDVELPQDFDRTFRLINSYLDSIEGEWDIFVGLLADLHSKAIVSRVDTFEGVDFVTLNKMTSMVFNIYNKNSFQMLAGWEPDQNDVAGTTIDRYLEKWPDLRVITAPQIRFGHRETAQSTLWGFSNRKYEEPIENSRHMLEQRVSEFKSHKGETNF